MSKSHTVLLRAGERVFINGAVVQFDRTVAMEVLNDAACLREHQVMQASETTTPLRQLYFVLQSMLIDPISRDAARHVYSDCYNWLVRAFSNEQVLAGLRRVNELVAGGGTHEALTTVRTLFPLEDQILGRETAHDRLLEAV